MDIIKAKDAQELGKKAAELTANYLNDAINKKGQARLLLATGKSQLTTLQELLKQKVEWKHVEVFHLDEYIGLTREHAASFQKYIAERFVDKLELKKAHYISGDEDAEKTIKNLTNEIRTSPVDVALVGIGENSHIAFNDPPADFQTKEAFIRVKLDEVAREQQVKEGWFSSINDVPTEAITMTVYQIMQSEKIISCVPYKSKAKAVKRTLESDLTNEIPATILKRHNNWSLFLDEDSSSLL
ncbi:glucosamine-6-phosphate deaminase [Lentibacillus persicus]|uniref:Glucosamine-6-phosphate deaminase n=1 Tax=Lentibacillus persicus TaxID=640948 RepID=A0A1I1YP92_9BACI|nr:glucosamine-6-phosphate deaminase [Lentibacillus persicus]SFE21415.1 glucosamine-6-phosphate deaminase [Lentibacillus persicus]